jgi:hypothetical protein
LLHRFNSYHEAFLRSRPDLTHLIKRLKNEGKRLPNIETEPDFYKMGFLPNINQPVQQFQPGGTAEIHSQHWSSAAWWDSQTTAQPTLARWKLESTGGAGFTLNRHEINFQGSEVHVQSHDGDQLTDHKKNLLESLITDSSSPGNERGKCNEVGKVSSESNVSKSGNTNPTEGHDPGGQSCRHSCKRGRTTISQVHKALLSNPPSDPLLQEFAEKYLPFFSSSESSDEGSGDAP